MSPEEIAMRKIRFTEHQIIAVLKSVEAGRTVKDVCREAAISEASYLKLGYLQDHFKAELHKPHFVHSMFLFMIREQN